MKNYLRSVRNVEKWTYALIYLKNSNHLKFNTMKKIKEIRERFQAWLDKKIDEACKPYLLKEERVMKAVGIILTIMILVVLIAQIRMKLES